MQSSLCEVHLTNHFPFWHILRTVLLRIASTDVTHYTSNLSAKYQTIPSIFLECKQQFSYARTSRKSLCNAALPLRDVTYLPSVPNALHHDEI